MVRVERVMRLDMVTNGGKQQIPGARLDATVDGAPQISSAGSASLARRDCRESRSHIRAASSVECSTHLPPLLSNGSSRVPDDVPSRRCTPCNGPRSRRSHPSPSRHPRDQDKENPGLHSKLNDLKVRIRRDSVLN